MNDLLLYNEYVILPEYTEFRDLKWNIREEQRLINSYSLTLPITKMLLLFPDRTWASIKHKALEYGLKRGNWKRWTSEEDRLLTELINKIGIKWNIVSQYFPDRTADSIMSRWYKKIRKSLSMTKEDT